MKRRALNEDATPPLVSVIIPTRDRLALLKEAVGSVLAQTLPTCEAVVVDDASSDETPEWLAVQESERLMTVVLQENRERAAARNRGLETARGKYVLFLDDDDRLRPLALKRLTAALDRHPDAIGAVGARVLFDERGNRRKLRHPRRTFKRMVWADMLVGWMGGTGAALWRTGVIRAVGGFNEKLPAGQPEDRELWIRASRRGPLVFIPDVVLENRVHSGQWKAIDALRLREQWMREYVEALPPDDKALGSRALNAYWLLKQAGIAYGNLHAREAFSLYVEAFRTAPSVLRSPLLSHRVFPPLAKSFLGVLVGGRIMLAARRAKERGQSMLRSSLRRDVERRKREIAIRDQRNGRR